ncbi:hypothetical protein Cyagr_2635 [Cyanobium gracile PCC 6307]|uniref:Uncharacterized protein n=2 Tax=Cyanobium gracile TaxID=59930 RepID=K9PAG1_CYAGP|nr:hypothetical protein Cyagr_2635 [Cyanobium gracile PCC 6307]
MESINASSSEPVKADVRRRMGPPSRQSCTEVAQDANAQPLLTMAELSVLKKRHKADQRKIKHLQQELRLKDKAPAEAAALL